MKSLAVSSVVLLGVTLGIGCSQEAPPRNAGTPSVPAPVEATSTNTPSAQVEPAVSDPVASRSPPVSAATPPATPEWTSRSQSSHSVDEDERPIPDEVAARLERRFRSDEFPAEIPRYVEYLRHEIAAVRREAAWALQDADQVEGSLATVVPALIQALDDPHDEVSMAAAYSLKEFGPSSVAAIEPLRAILRDETRSDRWYAAAEVLGAIGEPARVAIPDLEKAAEHVPDVAIPLGRLGAVAPLKSLALSTENDRKRAAATGLGYVRPATPEVVQILDGLLRDEDEYVREVAAAAFSTMEPKRAEAIPILMRALDDENGDVREKASEALGTFPVDTKTKILALLTTIRRSNSDSPYETWNAVGATSDEGFRTLIELARNEKEDPEIRSLAARAWGRFDEDCWSRNVNLLHEIAADTKLPIHIRGYTAGMICLRDQWQGQEYGNLLIEVLKSDVELPAREVAASAIGRLRPEKAIPVLIRVIRETAPPVDKPAESNGDDAAARARRRLASQRSDLRAAAAGALGVYGSSARSAIPVLIEAVADRNDFVARDAIGSLTTICKQDPPPEVLQAIAARLVPASNYSAGEKAAEALGDFGSAAAPAVPALIAALKSEGGRSEQAYVYALGEIGPAAKHAVPVLVAAANGAKDEYDRTHALEALAKIGVFNEEVIAAFDKGLADPDSRREVVKFVSFLGTAATPLVPRLTELLSDPFDDARRAAANALRGIGAEGRNALPALEKVATDDEQPAIRVAAAIAGLSIDPASRPSAESLAKILTDQDMADEFEFEIEEGGEPLGRGMELVLSACPVAVRLQALQRFGTRDDSPLRKPVVEAAIRDDDAPVRLMAMLLKGTVPPGTDVTPAVAGLIVGLESERDGYRSAELLKSFGAAPANALAAALVDDDCKPEKRNALVDILSRVPRLRQPARKRLEEALASARPETRAAAAIVLSAFEAEAALVVPALLEGISLEDRVLRERAADALENITGDDEFASALKSCTTIDAIIALLDDEAYEIQMAAVQCLRALQPGTDVTVQLLAKLKTARSPESVRFAIETTRPDLKIAVPATRQVLPDLNPSEILGLLAWIARLGTEGVDEVARIALDAAGETKCRQGAIRVLARWQEESTVVDDALIKLLDDPVLECREEAAVGAARRKIGVDKALPLLVDGLEGSYAATAHERADAIIGLGSAARSAIPGLIAMLKTRDKDPRSAALLLRILVGIAPDQPEVVTATLETLKNVDDDDVYHISVPLRPLGAPFVARLLETIDTPSTEQRHAVLRGLAAFGEDGRDAVPALVKFAQSTDPEGRVLAAAALASIEPEHADAAILLVDSFVPGDFATTVPVLDALGRLGARAAPAVPFLIRQLDVALTRDGAIRALGAIGPPAKAAVPRLIELLGDRASGPAAAEALGRIGPDAEAAVPTLLTLIEDEHLAASAGGALAAIGSSAAADRVCENLNDDAKRAAALRAVSRMGELSRPAVPKLIELARSDDVDTSIDAIAALAGLGPVARDAHAVLEERISIDFVAPAAIRALGELSRSDPDSAPKIVAVLSRLLQSDRPERLLRAAVRSLALAGPAAKSTLPLLRDLTRDMRRSDELRRMSAMAIENIGL